MVMGCRTVRDAPVARVEVRRSEHPGAAGSLDETLTLMAMNLPEWLERTLVTTNAIENLIGSVRNLGHRVRRWRDGTMILRWAATALIEASKQFRKQRGYAGMGELVAALRSHDAALDNGVDRKENAAQFMRAAAPISTASGTTPFRRSEEGTGRCHHPPSCQ